MEQFLVVNGHFSAEQADVKENIPHMLVLRQVVVLEVHQELVELHQTLRIIIIGFECLKCKLANSAIVFVEIVEKFHDVVRSIEEIQVV